MFDVTGLRHEAVNHAVKDHAVILTGRSDRGDLFNMFGGEIFEQIDSHGAIGPFPFDLNLKARRARRCAGQSDQSRAGHQGKCDG